jgi:N-terminal domain of galactosyltransferase
MPPASPSSRRVGARPAARGDIWAVVPCMGRLSHLRQTLPLVLRQPGLRYCLVDYACPDRCGDWVRRRYADEVRRKRIVVERVPATRYFNRSRAQNRGAARALREGARFLCFLDADTRLRGGFTRWLRRHVRDDRFLIAGLWQGVWHLRGTGGTLVVPARAFERSGGYEESFEGWGVEDTELRLRLYLVHGVDFGEIPIRFLRPISHADRLRTRFYRVKDYRVTYNRNRRKLARKVRRWRGKGLAELPPRARRLDMVRGTHRVGSPILM